MRNNFPSIHHADDVARIAGIVTKQVNGKWVAARPLGYRYSGLEALYKRIQISWMVFTGKADALVWEDQ